MASAKSYLYHNIARWSRNGWRSGDWLPRGWKGAAALTRSPPCNKETHQNFIKSSSVQM